MSLVVQDPATGQFVVRSKRHSGKTIEQVAGEDLNFLKWILADPKQYSELDDLSAYAVEDLLASMGELPEKFLSSNGNKNLR